MYFLLSKYIVTTSATIIASYSGFVHVHNWRGSVHSVWQQPVLVIELVATCTCSSMELLHMYMYISHSATSAYQMCLHMYYGCRYIDCGWVVACFVASGQNGVWYVVCSNVHSRRQQSVGACVESWSSYMCTCTYIALSAMPAYVACMMAVYSDF